MSEFDEPGITSYFPDRQWIGGLPFVVTTPKDAATLLCEIALGSCTTGYGVHLANAYTVALASRSPAYSAALSSGTILPDGKPISWVSRLMGSSQALSQVRGPQLFEDVLNEGRVNDLKHYILGSSPEVRTQLTRELQRKFPDVTIVGSESPPFRPMTPSEYTEQDRRILDSGAHIVWVGLGTPKQDFEVQRLASSLPVIAVAVGAAFDFSAGTLTMAPRWMRKAGLEWFYRFLKEPKRLWKRYLFGNCRFILAVVRNWSR